MRLRTIILLLAVLAGHGCGQQAAATARPSILLISVDTLRRDHLGCYGYERTTSPNIDALARDGTVFDHAISSSNWTLPAHASMLTGLYPASHGLQDDGVKLSPELPTLAEAFKKLGYQTLAVVSHVYVSSHFGLERGFDRFDDSLIQDGATNPIAGAVVDRFLELMSETPKRHFFAFVHFFDPHLDYDPPPPFDKKFTDPNYAGPIDGTRESQRRYLKQSTRMPRADRLQAIALYDGEIAYVDAEIGRLLKTLRERGRMENTLVVLTADHGEGFKDHGRLEHGRTLFGEQIRVPLIFSGHAAFGAGGATGGRGTGTRRSSLASPIDIAPTLLELAAGEPMAFGEGESLLEVRTEKPRAVFSESIRFGNETRAVRLGTHKLIHFSQGDRRFFFDLERDPAEKRPSPKDPSGGLLEKALLDYAAAADSGWHLKFIALKTLDVLKCSGEIQSSGHILQPRRYFSSKLQGDNRHQSGSFELSEDRRSLRFDISLSKSVSELVFETDPADASITLTLSAESENPEAGVFLGAGSRLENGIAITLDPGDKRLVGLPKSYTDAAPGCYVRAVIDPAATAPKSNLSSEAIQRLEALGYLDGAEENRN